MLFNKEISIKRTTTVYASSMTAIVNKIVNVEDYHRFVPWCHEVSIIEKGVGSNGKHYFIADLKLEIIGIKYQYRSKTEYEYNDTYASLITEAFPDQKIENMVSKWTIRQVGNIANQLGNVVTSHPQNNITTNNNNTYTSNELINKNNNSMNDPTFPQPFIVDYSIDLILKDLILAPLVKSMMPAVTDKILQSFIEQMNSK